MGELAQRTWFLLCLGLGRLLRAGRYSRTRVAYHDGAMEVRKHRRFYAPLLIRIGALVLRMLDTGVRILSQREWEARECLVHRSLRGTLVRLDAGGTLVLPYLAGRTLAALLEDRDLAEPLRKRAIELAVAALGDFHARGFSHADAMAENVMVDLESGMAGWFDFETIHDPGRPEAWRRADDLRALLATCLVRTAPADFAGTLQLILDEYADEGVAGLLAPHFTSVRRRPLAFHLGQAGLSFGKYRDIARLLSARGNSAGA